MDINEKLELCNNAKHVLENKIEVIEIKLVNISSSPDYKNLSNCIKLLDAYTEALNRIILIIKQEQAKIKPDNCSKYRNNGGSCK